MRQGRFRMVFGPFNYRLYYRPTKKYVAWPGGSLNRRKILVEDLRADLAMANLQYGFDEEAGAYAPMEVHRLNPEQRVTRTYLIQELL